MRKRRVLGVLLCACLVMGALPGVALAEPPEQTPPEGTPGPPQSFFTVTCPSPGNSPQPFTQTLPSTSQHGSDTSLEHSQGGEECE
jgi:hypothetical protein